MLRGSGVFYRLFVIDRGVRASIEGREMQTVDSKVKKEYGKTVENTLPLLREKNLGEYVTFSSSNALGKVKADISAATFTALHGGPEDEEDQCRRQEPNKAITLYRWCFRDKGRSISSLRRLPALVV